MALNGINSILNQNYTEFEYIIVDDGSNKETRDLLATIEDPRVKVITQANDGLSSARNRGFSYATGDYICYIDADDIRPPWAFGAIVEALDKYNPDVLFCRGVLSDLRDIAGFYDDACFEAILSQLPTPVASLADPRTIGAFRLAQLLEPQSANKVVRRSLFQAGGLHFPNAHFFEDIYFHTCALMAARQIAFLRTPTFTYFKRYGRPQLTFSTSDIRFDSVAVAKLTLERFAGSFQFKDPLWRAATLASCLKIVEWCGSTISHQFRYEYNVTVQTMLSLINADYLNIPANLPAGFEPIARATTYVSEILNA